MKYTHKDRQGMRWRFVGSRPVSELADTVMKESGLSLPLRKKTAKLFYNMLYRLKGHTPVPVTFLEWLKPPMQCGTQVAQSTLTERRQSVIVSTVFLGINHAHGSGPPLLFETMIFGGKQNGFCCRYSTWRKAVAGHRVIVRELRRKPKILKRSSLRP